MKRANSIDGRVAVALASALIAFAATAFAPQVLNDGDTFLHIAAGRLMLSDHAILFADPFSYTAAGAPWDAHEWLAEILMALCYAAGGWSGLLLLFACAASFSAGALTWHLGRWLSPVAQAITVLAALACMSGSLLARPHLLAMPLLVIWTAETVRARSEMRAPSLWLLPLMSVWINIHGSFLLNLALAGALALEALIAEAGMRRHTLLRWGRFGAGAVLACLINPHGIDGLLFPFRLMGTASIANIGEWQPTDFTEFPPMVPALAALLYVGIKYRVRIPLVRAGVVLGLVLMAALHQRHQIVAAAIIPLLIAEPFGRALAGARDTPNRWWVRIAGASAVPAIAALAAIRLLMPLERSDAAAAPITALKNVPAALRMLPVLNDYSFGGYLIFAGVRPFIDSRAELYGDAALKRYAALITPDPKALDAALARYDIRWSILSPSSPIVAELDARPGWRRVFADRYAIVHIRDRDAH
jgi:hypothetical protein